MNRSRHRTVQALGIGLGALVVILASTLWPAMPSATAASYTRISGDGSTWAGNAMNDWVTAIKAQGVTIDFNPDGSSAGRKNFAQGLSDFAVSEIPYTGDTADPQDTSSPPAGSYAMLPVVAGGTSFMYNVQVGGKRFQTLQLSQAALAGIFSGQITTWNDPAIQKTNPGVALPAQRITVVVRSDGSGATAQFTLWMLRQFPQQYAALCAKAGCNPHAATSYFPYQGLSNFVAQSGSNGVTTYTANTPYTINYDEYSYALGVGFPVAGIQNAAGFFTTPTAQGVAVALTQAKINQDKTSANYLSQDLSNVYGYKDPRTYPISAYSYMIEPTVTRDNFNNAKGATLAYFETFNVCEGQRTMGALGYSPLPMNLVLASMDQIRKVPGIDAVTSQTIAQTQKGVASGTGNPCNNPTFKPGDDPAHNVLIDTAPFPSGCNAACQAPWLGTNAATNHGPHGGGKGGPSNGGSHPTQGAQGSPTTTPTAPTGTSSATGSDGTAPPPGTVATSASTPVCDPDTGVCAAANTADDGTQLTASPAVINGEAAWGPAQAALILCGLIALLMVFAPPFVLRMLDKKRTPR